jgi:hypothetical protein
MQVTTVGLDIAKALFQLHGADVQGHAVLKRKLARDKVRIDPHPFPPGTLADRHSPTIAIHLARKYPPPCVESRVDDQRIGKDEDGGRGGKVLGVAPGFGPARTAPSWKGAPTSG